MDEGGEGIFQLKDTLKPFRIKKQKWDKTNLKINSFGQNKRYKKMLSFFFYELQLITILLLINNSYMSWSTRFISLKLCGIFYFRFRSVFIEVYIFVQQNARTLWL